jgi:uncharacterized membrane protein
MPGIFFTNLWMLLGLAALSVPIVIHLLLRRRKKRVRFSTVQFFLSQDEQASQRRKLRNWLLLALRLLICALLVLAFARPYLQRGALAGAGRQNRQGLIVLDRSLSMQANASDGPKWVRAKEAARQILSELKQTEDRAALISCGLGVGVLSEWAPPAVVVKVLADLQPTCGIGNLGEALRQARRLLSLAQPDPRATVYIISDLQRSACQNLASFPLPENADVKVLAVGDLVTPNLAVVDLQLEDPLKAQARAIVTSYSDEDAPELKLEFTLDGQAISSQSVALSAGATTNVALSLPPLKPGWHDAVFQVRLHDSLALDNTRYETLFVAEPVHVLVVETRRGQRSFEEESFFITSALDPGAGTTNGVSSGFALETIPADELAVRLASVKSQLPCDLVVLPGLKQVPSALGHGLTSYVQSGGGLLLYLGSEVGANQYNAEFREVLPATLHGVETCPDLESGWRIGEYDTNVAVFAAFRLPETGDLSLARFLSRFSLRSGESSTIVARFQDGTPLLLTRNLGRGRVVLANTSADTAWNDWPKHKTLVPWLHETANYLAGKTPAEPRSERLHATAGVETAIKLGAQAARAAIKVQTPEGKAWSVTADEHGTVQDLSLSTPGIYSFRDPSGRELRRVAVNVPPQESDLAAFSANDFQQKLARVRERAPTVLAGQWLGGNRNHRELWRVLLLSVVILLLVEVVVANRTLA